MKLKGFYKDKSAKPCVIDGCTFMVKPLNESQVVKFESAGMSGSADVYTYHVKKCFARDAVTGWSGLLYDNGEECEFSTENCIELLVDESYEELFSELYNFSFGLRRDISKASIEDPETAKK